MYVIHLVDEVTVTTVQYITVVYRFTQILLLILSVELTLSSWQCVLLFSFGVFQFRLVKRFHFYPGVNSLFLNICRKSTPI